MLTEQIFRYYWISVIKNNSDSYIIIIFCYARFNYKLGYKRLVKYGISQENKENEL